MFSTSLPTTATDAGYGGWQLTTTLTKRFRQFWVGGFLRGEYLGGSVFEDSPLVTQDTSWMGGLGVAWVFAESSKRVETK